jgi:hypothetical protein
MSHRQGRGGASCRAVDFFGGLTLSAAVTVKTAVATIRRLFWPAECQGCRNKLVAHNIKNIAELAAAAHKEIDKEINFFVCDFLPDFGSLKKDFFVSAFPPDFCLRLYFLPDSFSTNPIFHLLYFFSSDFSDFCSYQNRQCRLRISIYFPISVSAHSDQFLVGKEASVTRMMIYIP